jgi:hypothetical protein
MAVVSATQQIAGRRTSATISVPKSECTRVSLRVLESVASITQDENRRCGNIGSGRDRPNSDTTHRERGESQCEPIHQSCTCQSTTDVLRTPRALPSRYLIPRCSRRTGADRLSLHAPTCFRGHNRRVDRRHAHSTDIGFRQTPRAPRKTQDATCQPSWVRNPHSHRQTIFRELRSRSPEILSTPQCAETRKWSRA